MSSYVSNNPETPASSGNEGSQRNNDAWLPSHPPRPGQHCGKANSANFPSHEMDNSSETKDSPPHLDLTTRFKRDSSDRRGGTRGGDFFGGGGDEADNSMFGDGGTAEGSMAVSGHGISGSGGWGSPTSTLSSPSYGGGPASTASSPSYGGGSSPATSPRSPSGRSPISEAGNRSGIGFWGNQNEGQGTGWADKDKEGRNGGAGGGGTGGKFGPTEGNNAPHDPSSPPSSSLPKAAYASSRPPQSYPSLPPPRVENAALSSRAPNPHAGESWSSPSMGGKGGHAGGYAAQSAHHDGGKRVSWYEGEGHDRQKGNPDAYGLAVDPSIVGATNYTFTQSRGFSNAGPGGVGIASRAGSGPSSLPFAVQGSFIANITKPNFDHLPPIRKDFYFPHAAVRNRSNEDVKAFRRENHIALEGEALPPIQSWAELSPPPYVGDYLVSQNFVDPTPIQAQGIPMALSGRDLIGVSDTGSGKTLAYAIPALIHLNAQEPTTPEEGPIVLVLVPTRELACQIFKVFQALGESSDIKVACAYGGTAREPQLRDICEGVDVLIATPGRLIEYLSKDDISLERVTYFVLDEADRQVELGFRAEIELVGSTIRPDRQILMFTATWPPEVHVIAQKYLSNATRVTVGDKEVHAAQNITQTSIICKGLIDKKSRLHVILRDIKDAHGKVLVFCNSKGAVIELTEALRIEGHEALSLHGWKQQGERDFALNEFRLGTSPILVATDLAQRGLDIEGITHVVNFDAPMVHISEYVQRIGRCGRAKRPGHAITLFSGGHDKPMAAQIIKILEQSGQEVTEELRHYAADQNVGSSDLTALTSFAGSNWGKSRASPAKEDGNDDKPAASSWVDKPKADNDDDTFAAASVASAGGSENTPRPRTPVDTAGTSTPSPPSSSTPPSPSTPAAASPLPAPTSDFLIPTAIEKSSSPSTTVASEEEEEKVIGEDKVEEKVDEAEGRQKADEDDWFDKLIDDVELPGENEGKEGEVDGEEDGQKGGKGDDLPAVAEEEELA